MASHRDLLYSSRLLDLTLLFPITHFVVSSWVTCPLRTPSKAHFKTSREDVLEPFLWYRSGGSHYSIFTKFLRLASPVPSDSVYPALLHLSICLYCFRSVTVSTR